ILTFQKIADRCGITRTTLYIYFKNKREIFLWSIKQLTGKLETSLQEIMANADLTCSECLRQIFLRILDECVSNHKLFNVILDYLLQLQKSGKDPGERVRRRVVRLRHLLSQVIITGIDKGEFKNVSVKAVNEMFYSLFEASIFRLAILNKDKLEELIPVIDLIIKGIQK
ncbi:MAG: TetR/AcrR family transcriptional regulator, partial [Spirochaetaceae bacterium]|nr:TetR/AcrR family transcriptional regulator [Spirochaetaceae bacterium]